MLKMNQECLKAMLKEQEIAQQKVYKLYLISISKLKELRVLACGLYSKFDDWIINGIKFENQEIYNYLNFIRNSIQNQQKSNLKLQEHPPVSQIYLPLHYFTANPYFFPIFEKPLEGRFLVTDLKLLFEDVRSLTNDEELIDRKVLEEYLLRRKSNAETNRNLPKKIRDLKEEQVRRALEKLDVNGNSFINWKLFMNSMILMNSPLINEENEAKMIEGVENQEIDLDGFLNVSFVLIFLINFIVKAGYVV